MKRLLVFSCLFLVSCSAEQSKYRVGDCLTPTDTGYSWYGEHAKVEAYSKIEGFSGKNYILAFPKSISNSAIFSKEIESHTRTANRELCN